MTPECCTHWGWGLLVSLTGGKGENILTSLEVGGGGAGAMREARSRGKGQAQRGQVWIVRQSAQVGEGGGSQGQGEVEQWEWWLKRRCVWVWRLWGCLARQIVLAEG